MAFETFALGSPSSTLGRAMSLGAGSEFNLVSATGQSGGTDVLLVFTNPVDTTNSALFAPSSYTLSGGLAAVGAALYNDTSILLTTSDQVSGTSYSVTVSQTLTDVFNQTLDGNFATWVGITSYTGPYVVQNLDARPDCRGLAIYLDWGAPDEYVNTVKIVRRTRSWPFDLTDAFDLVYAGAPPAASATGVYTFLDTGVKEPITTLTAPAAVGATSISVASNTGYTAGMLIRLETLTGPANYEVVQVASTSGSTTVTLETGLVNAYSSGDRVSQSAPLQPQTYYYYLVLVDSTTSPGVFAISDGSRTFALSIAQYNGAAWFTNNTPRVALTLDAQPVATDGSGGGGGFLAKLYQVAGCWLNLMRGYTNAILLTGNDDVAPFHVLAAKNLSLGIEPEGLSYDFSIVRRALLSLVYVYKRKGACPGIVETVRMFTLWDATCTEFGLGGCDDGPVPLQTYDNQAQLFTGEPSSPTYATGSFTDNVNTFTAHQWLGGTFWGSVGDIACISDNTTGTFSFVAPKVVATLASAPSAGATTLTLSATAGIIPYLQIEVRNTAASVSEIHEVLSVNPAGPSIVLRDALLYSYSIGDTVSVAKDNTRAEYLGTCTSAGTGSMTDSSAYWEKNQWAGFQVMDHGGTVHNILSNTASSLTVSGVTPATGAYSIAWEITGSSFSGRSPQTKYQVGSGTLTRLYEPRYDLRERGTQQDPFNALYNGPGLNTSGAWGPNDVGVYITTPVTVANGRGTAVGNVLTCDPSQPALTPGALVGDFLNPNQNQEQMFVITANTSTTITVGSAIDSLVDPTQYYYVLQPRDANRFLRLSDRLRTQFTDTDTKPHVLFF